MTRQTAEINKKTQRKYCPTCPRNSYKTESGSEQSAAALEYNKCTVCFSQAWQEHVCFWSPEQKKLTAHLFAVIKLKRAKLRVSTVPSESCSEWVPDYTRPPISVETSVKRDNAECTNCSKQTSRTKAVSQFIRHAKSDGKREDFLM